MNMTNTLSTKEKSVHINIDSKYYGAIAEIGGGQETARHLFMILKLKIMERLSVFTIRE